MCMRFAGRFHQQILMLLVLAMANGIPLFAQQLATLSGSTMGTRYAVTVPERDGRPELHRKITARLSSINKLMSTYDPKSELSRFNSHPGTEWYPVSPETAHVVQFALQVAADTGGALDPTIGPLVNVWGFGPEGRRHKPPDEKEIGEVENRVGYRKVEARKDPPALRKKQADVYLDLSAIAKGYAVDQLVELLDAEGITNALVAIGGDIYAHGRKPDGSAWQVGIEKPDAPNRLHANRLNLCDLAVSTSGDWRNAFEHEGTRYSHVIDPRTARPVQHDVASVTVVADSSMEADATDTALLVMGYRKGLAWCENHNVAAIFLVRDEGGEIIVKESTHVSKKIETTSRQGNN